MDKEASKDAPPAAGPLALMVETRVLFSRRTTAVGDIQSLGFAVSGWLRYTPRLSVPLRPYFGLGLMGTYWRIAGVDDSTAAGSVVDKDTAFPLAPLVRLGACRGEMTAFCLSAQGGYALQSVSVRTLTVAGAREHRLSPWSATALFSVLW